MMSPRSFNFFLRIQKFFSCIALFGALLSVGFASAGYELKLGHNKDAILVFFSKDHKKVNPIKLAFDPNTKKFTGTDFIHDLLEIEPVHGGLEIKLSFKDDKNEMTALLWPGQGYAKITPHIYQTIAFKTLNMADDFVIRTENTYSNETEIKFEDNVTVLKSLVIINNATVFNHKNLTIGNLIFSEGVLFNKPGAHIVARETIKFKKSALKNDGTMASNGTIVFDDSDVTNLQSIFAKVAIHLNGGEFDNGGSFTTEGILEGMVHCNQSGTIGAQKISLTHIKSDMSKHITPFTNAGTMYASEGAITAHEVINNGTITGSIKTGDGKETVGNTFVIKADVIINKGIMLGGQKFDLQATQGIHNYGIWITNKQFSVTAPTIRNFRSILKEHDNDQGIHGPGSFTADCDIFDNALDAQFAIKGDVNLTARKSFTTRGFWHSDGNQQLNAADLVIFAGKKLEINGNGVIVCNNLNNQGLLAIGGNGIFNCSNYYNDGTTWTKGTMTFNVPGKFENRLTGRIESNGYVTIDATNFLNQAGFIFGHNGGRINTETFSNSAIVTQIGAGRHNYWTHSGWGPWREDHVLWCSDYATFSATNPPIIAISNGPLGLNIHKNGINEAGIIAVEKDIDIVAPVFANNQRDHEIVTARPCERGGHPSEASLISNKKFHAAITSSAGSARIKTSNVECKVQKQGEACATAGSFTNTGYIGAQQNIEFTAEGLAKFYNGLSQESNMLVIQENAHSHNIAIIPFEDDRNKYVYIKSNNPQAEYQFDHALVAQQPDQENDARTLVYLNDGKPWKNVPRRLLSPTLQAEGISQALVMMGRFILPGYETIFEQSLGMEHHGGMIGIVHGKPQAIGAVPLIRGPKQESSANTYAVSMSENTQLKALNTMYGGSKTDQELATIVQILSDGKHISTLTQEQIDALPYPFMYYARYKDTEYVIPVLHLPKEYQDKLWRMPGTLEAGGVVKLFNFAEAENTGQILGNQIIIKAQKVTNRKRTTSHIEGVRQSGGWFGSDKIIRYEVITPERFGGDMIAGVSIEILAHDDIVNKGGTIMSVDVLMKSTDGSIINKNNPVTSVIKWDTGFWGKAFGTQSSSLTMGFQPGSIVAAGNLEMLSPTQKIINEASNIVAAHGKLHGYLGILSETLTSVHTAHASTSHSWFAFSSEKAEGYSTGPSIMAFKDDVELTSEKGSFHCIGTQFKAKKATFNTQNNIFEPVTVTLHHKLSQGGVRAFEAFGSRTNIQQTVTIPTVLQIDEAVIKAALDNTLEAVFMVGTDGGAAKFIHFVAGRDNVFKGAHQTTTVDTDSFSMGVSFFGSEAAKQLLNGRVKDAVIKLAQEDPLVRSLEALKNAQDWQDKTGESAHVAVEALKLLVDRVESVQAGQSFKNFMGQRYGITDAEGHFAPLLRFRCSFTHTGYAVDQTIPSLVYVKDIIVDSGRNIEQLDGTKIIADNAVFVGDTMRMTSGATVSSMIQSIYGSSAVLLGKNLVAGGVDYTHMSADGVVHDNARVEVAKKLMVKVRELIAKGGLMLGNVVNMHAHNMCFESVQNLSGQNMLAGAFNAGFGPDLKINVQAGMAASSHDSAQTAERSGVFARNRLAIDATGAIKLIGANLEQIEPGEHGSYVKTSLLDTRDITDYDASDAQSFIVDTSAVKAAAGTPLDVNLQDGKKVQKQHSMISNNIDLHADKIVGDKFVRNAEEQTEVIEDSHSHWRIVAPVVDTKRVGNALGHLGDLFKNKAPQQSSYADFKKAFESVEHEASEATDSPTKTAEAETAQQTTSSKSDETPSFVKEEVKYTTKEGGSLKLESFSAPQPAQKTDRPEQSKPEYTVQPVYEDPQTGMTTISVTNGASHVIALTGSYQELEQFARHNQLNGQMDNRPLDKAATWRIVTSKLLNYAPIIGAGVGGCLGFFVVGIGAVPGAAMGAAIGQTILAPKAAVEVITGKDYLADEKVEGVDRAFAGLNVVLGGAAVTYSALKIVGTKVIATGVELAQSASKAEKVEVMGHTLTKHTLDKMAERDITKDVLQQIMMKGKAFKDANYPGAVRYVLERGISGQNSELSLAINPITKTIITVMRGKNIIGRNLRNGRFTPHVE